ncbi:MAG: HEPN domain-containing protein [Candidatus Sericytochromatia bacterium]|nr:HEPN domain-containing protein [Candidatus Tanganyikabacteria bacterium]
MSEEEYQAWLDAAARDLEAARTLAEAGNCSLAVFHYQQAAEKRIKALCALSGRPALTRSIVDLLLKLRSLDTDVPEPVVRAARRLDAHHVQSRYPTGLGVAPEKLYDEVICREAEGWAMEIVRFAESFRSTGPE